MKRYIYTTLLVFATLFCQASGVQNGWPTFYDTICAKPNQTINMADFESQILEILQNREDSLWSECCDVTVELEREPQIAIEGIPSQGWPDLVINTSKTVGVVVTYKRILTCSKIPTEEKPNMPPASLAMWHIFGDLLSEIETGKVTKVSDEASITTLHQATFFYRFELALPEDPLSQIIKEREMCLENPSALEKLHLEERYYPYTVNWNAPKDVETEKADKTLLILYPNDRYLFPIICTATACKGETRSDTIFIGKPTPQATMEDISCIASSENSFVAKVKGADSRLSYHWIFEEPNGNRATQFEQGDSVSFEISLAQSGVLRLYSTGGCRASDTVTQELHRSVVAGNIQLQGDTNCVFIGDTLRFVLQNAPQDSLVWKSETDEATLFGNAEFICNTTGLHTISFKVSVANKNCPESVDSKNLNIRKDLAVSIESYESCIRTDTAYVFKVSGNGINPEVHWDGNGVEIDSTTYSTKDSILLRLTNPGGQNLYVAVKAKECGRERDTLLVLRPKPEMPSLDPLSEKLTPCIPLGIADTIELRVQPQEGVKFEWPFSGSSKFEKIGKLDSNSIRVRVNYESLDRDTIPVSVYAYTDGCPNSDTLLETVYATGAGLEEKWDLLQQNEEWGGYIVGFSEDGVNIKYDGFEYPFNDPYEFDWYSKDMEVEDFNSYYCEVLPFEVFPLELFCRLTSVEKQCYSVYSIEVVDMMELQGVLFEEKKRENVGERKEKESLQEQASFENEDIPCPGIALHPNPVRSGEQVRLEGICETESFTVECYSQQGRCLFRTSAKGETFSFPTGSYAAGVYIIRIQPDGAAAPIIKKLIII